MNKEEQFNFVEKYLDFKGEINADWKKYILLEKLLQSLDDSKQYNSSMFSKTNTKKLIDFYKNPSSNLRASLRSRYIFYFDKSGHYFDDSNFNKMLNGSRKANIYLLNALADILVKGYFDDSLYSYIEPLEKFSNCTLFSPAYRYIEICIAVSILRNEELQAYDIKNGNDTLMKLITSDLSRIIFIQNHKPYISSYIHRDYDAVNDYDMKDDYSQSIIAELYAPMPRELPHITMSNYERFNHILSKGHKLTDALPHLSVELLIWLNMYFSGYYKSQDLYFHQLLFFLSFVSEDTLNEYLNYVPPHNLNILSAATSGYYTDIKHILEIPSISDFSLNIDICLTEFHLEYLNRTYMSFRHPRWLLFTLCHLTNKQMQTAKYLYVSLVLRKRYHPQKNNDSFPAEIIELLRLNVPDVDELCDICSCKYR